MVSKPTSVLQLAFNIFIRLLAEYVLFPSAVAIMVLYGLGKDIMPILATTIMLATSIRIIFEWMISVASGAWHGKKYSK